MTNEAELAPPRPLRPLLEAMVVLALMMGNAQGAAAQQGSEPTTPTEAATGTDFGEQPVDDGSIDLRIERLLDDFEHREERAAKAQRLALAAERRAALDRLGTVPTPEAFDYGRAAANADPGNFSLRLRLIDLLRRGGLPGEADARAAALIAEAPVGGPGADAQALARLRALLHRVRIAYDQRDYPTARGRLADLAALAPPPELMQAATELAARITAQEHKLALRAEVDRLRALPPADALPLARAGVRDDPTKLDLRLLLMDLLADSGEPEEADALARAFATDPLTAAEPNKRQAALFKRAEFALQQNDFATARARLTQAAAGPTESPEQAARAAARTALLHERIAARERDLAISQEIEKIGQEPTPQALAAAAALYRREPGSVTAAFHYARLQRKAQAFAEAEAIYRQVLAGPGATDPEVAARAERYLTDLKLRAEIVAIGQEPTAKALAQIEALRQREPESVDAAFHHALLLRKQRSFEQAEAIYNEVLAGPGVTDPETADRARLNLADLFLRSNRVGDAATLVRSLNPLTSSQYVANRSEVIGERITERLRPNRLAGFVGITAGHDSNAATRADLLDEDTGDLSVDEVGSSFQTLDLYSQYQRVIDGNGNVLAASANASNTFYNDAEVGDIDRSSLDLRVGPIYALPGLDAAVGGGISYRYRLRDYHFARRSPGLFLSIDRYLSSRWRLRADSLFEYGTDTNPDRDGMGYQAGVQSRYALTPVDKLSLTLRARHDDADAEFETRTAYGMGAAYRHQFTATTALPRGWFWETAANFNRVDYEDANPRPEDLGKTRNDHHWQFDTTAGFDLSELSQIELRASYLDRTSNLDRYDTDSLRLQLNVTRTY